MPPEARAGWHKRAERGNRRHVGNLQYEWHTGATEPTIEVLTTIEAMLAEVMVTDKAGQSVRVRANVCGRGMDWERHSQRFLDTVYAIMELLARNGFHPGRFPRGGPDPAPEPFGPFVELMRRWVLSTDSVTLAILDQRQAFLESILTRARETEGDRQAKVLAELDAGALKSVRSRKYRETLKMDIKIPQTEWNQNRFEEANELMKEIVRNRPQ